MIRLAANHSTALLEIIKNDSLPLDLIEVGPWFSLAQIQGFRRQLPQYNFIFHGSNQVARLGLVPGTTRRLRAYLECTNSPWASVHINLLPPGVFWLYRRWGWLPPLPPVAWSRGSAFSPKFAVWLPAWTFLWSLKICPCCPTRAANLGLIRR